MPRLQYTEPKAARPRKKAQRAPEHEPLPRVALSVYTWPGTLEPAVVAQTTGNMDEEFAERLFAALAREICDRLGIEDLRDAAA